MIGRLQARWLGGADWGPSFWWFLLRYYAMPWFAWSWLRVRQDGAVSPVWFKVSQIAFSTLRFALVVFLWLMLLVSLDLNAAVPVILGAAAVLATVTGVMRAQYAHSRYGGDR